MIITFHGHCCFRIQTSGVTILTEGSKGETSARLKADIFIKTTPKDSKIPYDHLIKGPGEYEIKGVEIKGYPSYIYLLRAEGMKLGYFGETEIKDPAFDADIIFASATAETAKAIRQHQPKIIVVVAGDVKELEKELGLKAENLDKLTIKKKDLDKSLRIVCLKT